MEIEQTRPTVTGDTEFGTQVFAIWNSIVFISSVIADSEVGAFEIQAPRDLATDTNHRVTLYAVKTAGGITLRSDSVDVYFKILAPPFPYRLLWILLLILILILIMVSKRRDREAAIEALIKQTRRLIRLIKNHDSDQ